MERVLCDQYLVIYCYKNIIWGKSSFLDKINSGENEKYTNYDDNEYLNYYDIQSMAVLNDLPKLSYLI